MNQLSYEATPQKFDDILSTNGNSFCVDCNDPHPDWVSLGFGTVVCLNCAGHHRALGTHLTLVRSIKLDSWTTEQIQILKLSGNIKFQEYLETLHSVPDTDDRLKKYSIPEVLYYRLIAPPQFFSTS